MATVRALKMHGGVAKNELTGENLEALSKGITNLEKHIENMKRFGIPVVVAINRFTTDTEAELELVKEHCVALGVQQVLSEVWAKGGEGGIELAERVLEAVEKPNTFHKLYDASLSPKEKIEKIAKEIYGAKSVAYMAQAEQDLEELHRQGKDNLLVCMGKTQASISDNPALIGRPEGFELTVREVRLSAGAGFIVPITGSIMTMPGLPKVPAAMKIDVDDDGNITGLF